MTEQEKLYRTWGEYLGYPQCCIEDFVTRVVYRKEMCPDYMSTSPFYRSGFIPCEDCHTETKVMTKEESIYWLGHDPFYKETLVESYVRTLKIVNSMDFLFIAYSFNLDVEKYISSLRGYLRSVGLNDEGEVL